jgi:hypothetical protein
MINRSTLTRGRLWNDLAESFTWGGFGGHVQTGFQDPADLTEYGVMICTPDVASPTENDSFVKRALEGVGIVVRKFIPLSECPYRGDVTVFVGPDQL